MPINSSGYTSRANDEAERALSICRGNLRYMSVTSPASFASSMVNVIDLAGLPLRLVSQVTEFLSPETQRKYSHLSLFRQTATIALALRLGLPLMTWNALRLCV